MISSLISMPTTNSSLLTPSPFLSSEVMSSMSSCLRSSSARFSSWLGVGVGVGVGLGLGSASHLERGLARRRRGGLLRLDVPLQPALATPLGGARFTRAEAAGELLEGRCLLAVQSLRHDEPLVGAGQWLGLGLGFWVGLGLT